ncbi:MAG: hypothetical protein IPG11_04290 [Flavobacteriales bacterium]|nr:hypothetical protein [Flavobacteriales bacterium]
MKNPEPIFRAYSMANHPAEGNIVMLNIRIATPPWERAKNGWTPRLNMVIWRPAHDERRQRRWWTTGGVPRENVAFDDFGG